jgi:Fe-S cluster biosynthesis and repair protein YggX
VGSLNGIRIGQQIPGPVTKRLLETWSARVELDIVEQALSHLSPEERQALEGQAG